MAVRGSGFGAQADQPAGAPGGQVGRSATAQNCAGRRQTHENPRKDKGSVHALLRPDDGLRLNSSDNDFYPLVRLEVWDGPASRTPDDWDHERHFRAPLREHMMVVDLGGVSHGIVRVPSGTYCLRVLCRGREHLEGTLALESSRRRGRTTRWSSGWSRCGLPADPGGSSRQGLRVDDQCRGPT